MFIDFSKQMGDPGINSGLLTLENSFGELGENILFVRSVYDHGGLEQNTPENEDHKGLPDLLAFKSCTAYMGNQKQCSWTSSEKRNHQFSFKGTTGVESSVKSWE